MAYGKIHSSILNSSIWQEPYSVRVVWVAIIATRDQDGYIYGSMRGLARSFGVTVDEMREAMDVLTSPDEDSQSMAEEGRRLVERVVGGRKCWEVVNHDYYRRLESKEERRERDAARKRRARTVRKRPQASANVQDLQNVPKYPPSDTDTDTESESESETTTPQPPKGPSLSASTPETDQRVSCPRKLRLLDEQVATLETALVPRWAIDELSRRFILKATADPSDKRSLASWRKCLAIAVNSDWNDALKRPKKPATAESTAIGEAAKAAAAARLEARRKAKFAENKAFMEGEVPPKPDTPAACKAAMLKMAGATK